MNQDLFYFDISNQNSNEPSFGNSEFFYDINSDILDNIKNNPILNLTPLSFNNFQSVNSSNKVKNDCETALDEEKFIKINTNNDVSNNPINNNFFLPINHKEKNNDVINNNFNNINTCLYQCSKCKEFLPINEKKILEYEDLFLNSSVNCENNVINFTSNDNHFLNFNFNFIDKNTKSNISINKIEKNTNNLSNNLNQNNKLINLDKNDNNAVENERGKIDLNIKKKIKKNSNKRINKNLLGIKRKEKKRKKENIKEPIIQYGHPQKIIYKTVKQKLNIHKKLDSECRNDTFLLIYTISKLKNIFKNEELKGNIKDKINLQRIKDLYHSSIVSLEHREYAQDITGYKLL